MGGQIVHDRVLGLLAISRSFGDHGCKRYVTVDPYIKRIELTGEDEFVVLACDGVFDVLEDEDVTRIVKEEIDNVGVVSNVEVMFLEQYRWMCRECGE